MKNLIERLNALSLTTPDSSDRKYVILRISALLCSPLVLALPSSIHIYVAVFALTSALRAFVQGPQNSEGGRNREDWRRYVPPIWMLTLGNMIMTPLWFLGPEGSFPKSYDRVIVAVRPHNVNHGSNACNCLARYAVFETILQARTNFVGPAWYQALLTKYYISSNISKFGLASLL